MSSSPSSRSATAATDSSTGAAAPVPAPAAAPTAGPAQGAPCADCTADSAGGLTFDVAASGAPDAALVLRRSGGPGSDDVRLPLTPVGQGRLRAVLPSTVDLPEGRWETRVHGAGRHLTVLPGLRDLRALVDRTTDPRTEAVAVRIPYATSDGLLAVRSWRRAPHAEAGDIVFADDGTAITFTGRLYGIELGPGAAMEARLRGGKGRVHREPASGQEHDFVCTLPVASLAEGRDGADRVWDLWLVAAPDTAPIRVSRLLDDIAEKQRVFTYPALSVGDDPKTVAFPYYTVDNDLAVKISTP